MSEPQYTLSKHMVADQLYQYKSAKTDDASAILSTSPVSIVRPSPKSKSCASKAIILLTNREELFRDSVKNSTLHRICNLNFKKKISLDAIRNGVVSPLFLKNRNVLR